MKFLQFFFNEYQVEYLAKALTKEEKKEVLFYYYDLNYLNSTKRRLKHKHKHKHCVFRLNIYTILYNNIIFHGNYPISLIIDIT